MQQLAIRNYVIGMLILFLLFPVYGLALVLFIGEDNKSLLLFLVSPYIIYFLYRGLRSWVIECPRCKQAFFRKGIWFGSVFRCNHCQLSIFDSGYSEKPGGDHDSI